MNNKNSNKIKEKIEKKEEKIKNILISKEDE